MSKKSCLLYAYIAFKLNIKNIQMYCLCYMLKDNYITPMLHFDAVVVLWWWQYAIWAGNRNSRKFNLRIQFKVPFIYASMSCCILLYHPLKSKCITRVFYNCIGLMKFYSFIIKLSFKLHYNSQVVVVETFFICWI